MVFELPGDPPGAFGPTFDLMMSVETAGRARRISELVELLVAAGYVDVAVSAEHARPHTILVGLLTN